MTIRREIVTTIKESIPVECMLSTGNDPSSLKDLLVVGAYERQDYLNNIRTQLAKKAVASYICDDALIVTTPSMGLAYYDRTTYFDTLDNLYQGRLVDPVVKPWSTGPWLPEAFASDLSRTVALRDVDDIYAAAHEFDTYPAPLQEAICTKTILEMKLKLERVESAGQSLGGTMLAADICLAGLRYLHAENSVYFRGLRYINETIHEIPASSQLIAAKLVDNTSNYTYARDIVS